MAYYTYFPCPGSTGVQFTSNVAPAYPGAYIQFTSGGPELAPYLGKCYHISPSSAPLPPGSVSINWATAVYNSTFTKCEDCVEQLLCGDCPPGYTLVNGECILTESVPANYTGGLVQVEGGDISQAYNKFGLRLYPDISGFTFPLVGNSNPYTVRDNNGTGVTIIPLISALQSKLWGVDQVTNMACGPTAVTGRLNAVGIWSVGYDPPPPANPPLDGPELSFEFCVTIEQSKQYLIGIAGDNKVKMYIDGNLKVFLDIGGPTGTATFNYWHVFPITLSAGVHTIKLSGINNGYGSQASFGAEVYDITLATFQANLTTAATTVPNCGNVAADLLPYIIFSTGDYVDTFIPDPADPGVWECPEGYTLDECNGIPQCSITTAIPTIPCAYELVSCCDPNDTYLASLPGISTLPPVNIIVVNPGTSSIPPGCYDVVDYSQQASGIPTLIEDVNYVLNGGCSAYPFVCNSYCGTCTCVRLKVKIPSGPGTTALLYWTCNLITNEDGDIVPEIAIVEVPTDGSWSEYICGGGFIVTANQFDFESNGLCTLDIQTDTYECPKYYQLSDCVDPNNTLCVTNNLYNLYITNSVVQILGYPDTCWEIIELEEPCEEPVTVVITQSFIGCQDCLDSFKTYYKLVDCVTGAVVVYTETDLSLYVGQYIQVSEFPDDCWYVEQSSLAVSPVDVSNPVSFATCEECNKQYYVLEDCNTENPQPNIYTGTDLSIYVGLVITLEYCPEICWLVSETDVNSESELVNVTGSYTECEICQVAVLPCQCSRILNTVQAGIRFSYYDCDAKLQLTPPLAFNQYSQKVCAKLWVDVNPEDIEYFGDCVDNLCPPDEKPKKSIRPGYNTPGCTPEKYERIMCNFSESVYKQMVSIRFGIHMCCGDDDIRWEIEKELIKLKAIEDPDYNCSIEPGCDCTTSATGLTPCKPE
jgi:hypothetical protein